MTIWTPAVPPGLSLLKSQAFQMTCRGDGLDMVYRWSINMQPGGGGVIPGPTEYGRSYIYPWETGDILIRAVHLLQLPPAPGAIKKPPYMAGLTEAPGAEGPPGPYMPNYSFLMVGNNAWGDAMLYMDDAQLSVLMEYPGSTGFPFPGIANKTPLTYLDLHGSCTAGYDANVMLTFWYTPLVGPCAP